MTRVLCGVSQGDLPISIHWLKDGHPVKNNGHKDTIQMSSLDPYSSILKFPSLSTRNSGMYTCAVSNPASKAYYSAKLVVQGKTKNSGW